MIDTEEEGKGDGHDPGWCGVLSCIGAELAPEAEVDRTQMVQAWVFGPHAGKALAHRPEVLLNRALSDI